MEDLKTRQSEIQDLQKKIGAAETKYWQTRRTKAPSPGKTNAEDQANGKMAEGEKKEYDQLLSQAKCPRMPPWKKFARPIRPGKA